MAGNDMKLKGDIGASSVLCLRHRRAGARTAATLAAAAAAIALTGTASAQFSLIKDINPGPVDSSPSELIAYNSGIYFAANDGTSGNELWGSGGTADTTFLIKDINPGPGSSNPTGLTVWNGGLYFAADDGDFGVELWRSFGNTATTELVADINEAGDSSPAEFTDAGSLLYFSADGGNGRQVWQTDGNITSQLTNLNPGVGSNPTNLFFHNGILYFAANDGTNGNELWIYDGLTPPQLVNINPGAASSNPAWFAPIGTSVVFAATTAAAGREIWISNGTVAGTALLRDIEAGAASSNPEQLVARTASEVVFTAVQGNLGREPWRTNGTLAGTVLIENVRTGANNGSDPTHLTAIDGIVYMGISKANPLAPEPWAYDGTSVFELAKLGQGNLGSEPGNYTAVGSVIFFTANDQNNFGHELWRTEGTAATTVFVQDINPGLASSTPLSLVSAGGGLFFSALSPSGRELWGSTGIILAVELDGFTATADTPYSPVVLSWTTTAELDNVGFLLYRANPDGSRGDLLSPGLIPAEANATEGATYTFTDPIALNGADDWRGYFLVDVDVNGQQTEHGPIGVRILNQIRDSSVEDWSSF